MTKGPTRAMVHAEIGGEESQNNRDEIRHYEDLRLIGSSEAGWSIKAYPIAENYPAVKVLRIHLENQQHVYFEAGEEESVIEKCRETELTTFFRLNAREKEAKGDDFNPNIMPCYVDLPETYTYRVTEKEWHLRQRIGFSIGRVHSVCPLAGDVFYLRILLHHFHCRGKTSFRDLMCIAEKVCDSYQEVCRELGLLSSDQEWVKVLKDAASTQYCNRIRELFVIILMFCQPSDPKKLFEKLWVDWTDDLKQNGEQMGYTISDNQLKTMVRLDLQQRLQSYEKNLHDLGLDQMTNEERSTVSWMDEDPLVRDEKQYDITVLKSEVKEAQDKFTVSQQDIYEIIMEAVKGNKPLQLFISARGGCGKTFLLNTVLKAVRSLEDGGCIALAMGTTGISAQLLQLGRTFHAQMKAPIKPTEESTLNIPIQINLKKLVEMARLLLIDEATMLHRFHLEALDRTLRYLLKKPTEPFGGKILILAGDFRQCLPVVRGANRAQSVQACIKESDLWMNFEIRSLTENVRVRASGDPVLENFDKWTLSLGDGIANDENDRVSIPEEMLTQIKDNTKQDQTIEEGCLKEFCEKVFPNLKNNLSDPTWLEGRAILAPTNKQVDTINDLIESWVPGEATKLSSADTLENQMDVLRFNTELLNIQRPNGFPRHIITLKPGMPLMLLRNLNPKEGLCNGTKLIFISTINNRILVCKKAGTNEQVLIPRIKFLPDTGEYTYDWARLQFPVRVAFATTINKSQGQTLSQVGVWIPSPVFNHGQLYVACSRVGKPTALNIAIKQEPGQPVDQTDNIIFKEVLLSPD